MTSRKIILGALFSLVLFFVAYSIVVKRTASKMCASKIINSINSPDNKYKAILFKRECKNLPDIFSEVSIIEVDEELDNEDGNIFSADTFNGISPRAEWGGPEVKISWKENSVLLIEYHTDAKVYTFEREKEGIKIEYKKTGYSIFM